MKKINSPVIFAVLVILTVAVFTYVNLTTGRINNIESQIQKLDADISRLKGFEARKATLVKLLSIKYDLGSFIEDLYLLAQKTGLKNYEAVTAQRENMPQARQTQEKIAGIKRHSIRIFIEGQYRETAEYIRMMQNMEGLNRVVSLEIKPDGGNIKTTLILELLSAER